MKTKNLIFAAILFHIAFTSGCAQDNYLRFEKQVVVLEDFEAEGYILAIGGGGEGTIGRLKGSQVIAVDILKRELEEAPDGPLKIIMDARDLQFLDNTFNTATAFFTLLYIHGDDHEKVFQEVYRVLKPNGKFLIWDANIPNLKDTDKDRVLVTMTIKLPDQDVETGYGVRLPNIDHDLSYYIKIAEKAGFKVVAKETKDKTFFLELQKTDS